MFISYADLIAQIQARPTPHATRIVAVDGCGGAGKSTFGRRLTHAAGGTLVQMDDFYRPRADQPVECGASKSPASAYDWPRLNEQVLRPLVAGQAANYQRYDWPSDSLAEWHPIAPGGLVVVEGTYSLYPALRPCYTAAVMVETPREIRLARGIERDGEAMRPQWVEDWMPAEDRYMALYPPQAVADWIVDGGGLTPAPDDTVVLIASRPLAP
jgi:uridine kinase